MLKPLNDHVMILPDTLDTLPSGLAMPEKTDALPVSGVVASKEQTALGQLFNKRVWFKAWAGEEIHYGNVTYRLVHLKDLVAWDDGKGVK